MTRAGNGHTRDDIRHFTPRIIVKANMRAGVVDVRRFTAIKRVYDRCDTNS
jgi:hypothetical protein